MSDLLAALAGLSGDLPVVALPKLVAEPPKVAHKSKYAVAAPAMVNSLVLDGKSKITAENGVFYTNSKSVADQLVQLGGTLL